MARGWESKSVESQIESAGQRHEAQKGNLVTPDMADAIRKKETLRLARTHLLQQLSASTNHRHQEMLEKALADLNQQISDVKAGN